LRDCF